MANFNVDQSGNMWIGTNVSNTFSTAQSDANTKFYVESDGTIKAEAGTVGGIVIDADGIESDNFDASTNTGWRLDNATGIAQYFDIDINLEASNNNSPSDTQFIGFGVGSIYGNSNSNDLVIAAPQVAIQDSSGTPGATSPSLIFTDGTYSNPGFYAEENNADQRAEFYFSNGTHDIFHTRSGMNTLYLDATYLSVHDGIGNNGQVLTRTSNGLEWVTPSAGTVYTAGTALSLSGSTFNVDLGTTSSTAAYGNHTHSYDNYNKWLFQANDSLVGNVLTGYGVSFNNGTGTTVSTDSSPYRVRYNVNFGASGTSNSAARSDHDHGISTHVHTSVLSFSANEINIYGSVKPSSNNSRTIGTSSSLRFADMYSQEFYGQYFYGTLINSSSENVKTNIADTGLGLDFIEALPIKQFNYITEGHSDKKYTGVIAEDVQDILDANGWEDYYLVVDNSDTYRFNNRCQHPAICTCGDEDCEEGNYSCQDDCCSAYFKYTEEDGTVTNWVHHTVEECEAFEVDGNRHPHFNYYQLVGPLVKAVQELSTQISDLTARVELLEG